MASIFDRIRAKASQAFTGIGNSIDRDQSMGGVQLAQGGLGNRISQAAGNMARSVSNTPLVRLPFSNQINYPIKSPTIGDASRSIRDNIIRPVPRAIQTLSSSVGQAIGADDGVTSPEEIRRAMPYKPARDFFYGENPEPILSLQNQTANNAPRNASWLQDRGVSPGLAQGVSTPLTFLGITGLAGLDAVPNDPTDFVRAVGKNTVKEALPLVDDVAREGLPLLDDVLRAGKKVAPALDDVLQPAKSLDEVLQTAKSTLNPDPLMAEAKKYGNAEEFGTVKEWGTRNQYLSRNPFRKQLDQMKLTGKFDEDILKKTEQWELEQVLKDKPAYLADSSFLSKKEVKSFANKHKLWIRTDKLGALVVAKDIDSLNRVLNAKNQRELGLSLGYEDLLKTKQQLTDFYNQSTPAKSLDEVLQPALPKVAPEVPPGLPLLDDVLQPALQAVPGKAPGIPTLKSVGAELGRIKAQLKQATDPEIITDLTEKEGFFRQAYSDLKRSSEGVVAKEGLPLLDAAAKKSTPFVDANRLFKNWVNTREGVASFRADSVKTNPALTMFDKEGMKAITEMQSGANPDKFKAVKQFTDDLFDTESKAGLSEANNYQPNYLPQLWENPPEEIAQAFQRRFGNQPGFSKQRIFDTYQQGIDAGLTPKFDAISDLLTSRSKSATRALADSEFTNSLIDSGQALPFDQAPKGWKNVPELQQGKQKFAVDPKIAQKIQNYTEPGSEILNKVGRFVSEAKQSLLSAGVPKTGWNFHTGVNIPARAVAARNNPFKAVVDTVIWNTFPGEAVKSVDRIPVDIREGLIRNSLTVGRSVDDAGYGFKPEVGKGIISKARGTFDKLFSEAAFDKVLPAQKYQVAVEAYQKALKSGVNKEDALRIGAETSNAFFGGVNAQELGRSKDFQNIMRTFLLAPDWLESNFKIAKKTSGALLNPSNWSKAEYAPYRQFARNATFMYASMAMTNKAVSGHWPWENGAGQEFNLATGTFDERGRERMISPFGTAFDFARIPLQLVQAAGEGDVKGLFKPLRNRLSPPVGALANIAITGEDYRGRPIDTPGELGSQIAQGVGVPSQATNIIGGLTGEQTPEEVGVGLLEAPIRYRGGANTKEKRQSAIDLKDAGLSNKEIGTSLTSTPQKDGGLLSKLFGAQASTNPTLPDKASKKQVEAFNESIDAALEAGSVPNNQALAQRFFSGKSATSKSIEERMDTYKALKTTMNDEFSTPEQKQAILGASGASPELYEYYNTASKDKDVKLQEILPKLDTMDSKEIVESLMKGRRKVAGNQLVTDEMVSYLYENDYISKDEQKAIKALKWDEINDKPYFTKSYTKSESGSLSYSQAKKLFNVELPKFSRLKSLDYLSKSSSQGGSQRAGGDDRLIDTLLNAPNKRRSGSGNLWF